MCRGAHAENPMAVDLSKHTETQQPLFKIKKKMQALENMIIGECCHVNPKTETCNDNTL